MTGAGRGGLWRHLDFRRLWIGETVSQLGSAVTVLALPLVAILTVHASTFEVGLLTACQTLAFLVVGLPVGALVDRMRFRRVLIAADVVRVLAIGSVPLASALDSLRIGQLYVVALVTGVATVFFDVAYQSYLPELVGRGAVVEGNAKLQGSESVAQIAGPALGGLLVAAVTAPLALAADALSFAWSAGWVAAIRRRPPPRERDPHPHLGREIAEGLGVVLRNPMLRACAACTGSINLFGAMNLAVIYVLLARGLHLSAGAIGLLTSAGAVGGLLGAVFAGWVIALIGQGRAIWMTAAVAGPMTFAAPFVHRDWTLAVYVVAAVLTSASVVVYNIAQVSFRQALAPPHMLGRMNATMRFLVWGTLPLGGLLGGVLGSAVGIRSTLLVVAIGSSLAFLPVYFSPLRHARTLPTHEMVIATG